MDQAPTLKLWLELGALSGYSGISVPDGGEVPLMVQSGGFATLGFVLFDKLLVGAACDYRLINQHSEPTYNVGNYRGTRLIYASPYVGVFLGDAVLKFQYQFMGDYKLKNNTQSGSEMTYKKPTGFQGSLSYRVKKRWSIGMFYETVSFNKLEMKTVRVLNESLTLWQAGVMLTINLTKKPLVSEDMR